MRESEIWPDLSYSAWRETAQTLHLWTQIVGKTRLKLTPWLNHSWHVTLYVSDRGLTTSPIPYGDKSFEVEFDFVAHRLRIRSGDGAEQSFALQPQTVADFHAQFFGLLKEMGVSVVINDIPSELPDPVIPLSQDGVHAAYGAAAANRFWRALVQTDRMFKHFRSGFLGKASPVHFFWGSFDLAVTRFSGRKAPLHPGGVPHLPDAVAREAYSHEVSSAGFWPGNDSYPNPVFYSYAYPEPDGFRARKIANANFDTNFGEFMLPYEMVRDAVDPDAVLLDFLSRTYDAAADLGHWDRAALECAIGEPGKVRSVS
jgi:hypothetical protein